MHIRAHSCPFVVLPLHPPSCFFVFFVYFVVQTLLGLHFLHIRVHSCPFVVQASIWTTFVSIRVHSWFSLIPLLRVFSCFSCFSWFKHCLDYVFAYSCPFVFIRGSPSPPPRVFRGSNTTWTTFVYIRVHSCPFVVLPLPPPSCFSCFSWFDSPFSCLMRRAQARHPRTTLSSLLPSLYFSIFLFSKKST